MYLKHNTYSAMITGGGENFEEQLIFWIGWRQWPQCHITIFMTAI